MTSSDYIYFVGVHRDISGIPKGKSEVERLRSMPFSDFVSSADITYNNKLVV